MKKFALQLLESYDNLHEQAPAAMTPEQAISMAGESIKAPRVLKGAGGGTGRIWKTTRKTISFQRDAPNARANKVDGPGSEGYDDLAAFLSGAATTQQPVQISKAERQQMERDQRQQETVDGLNEAFPGLGDSVNSLHAKLNSVRERVLGGLNEERLHSQFFSNANNSVRTLTNKMIERDMLFVEQSADTEEKGTTIFEREPPSPDQARRAFKNYEKLITLTDQLMRGQRDPKNAIEDIRRMKQLLMKNEKGQVFIKIDGRSLGGICLMPSERHSLNEVIQQYEKEVDRFTKDNSDLLDEGETLALDTFDFSKSSFNHSNVVKEVSETLEMAAHHIANGDASSAKPYLLNVVRQYKDSIGKALQLQRGMLSEDDAELGAMLTELGIEKGTKDEVEKAVVSIVQGYLKPRIDFYNRFKPDFVSRVGEGDVGKGFKPDNMLVWKDKPTDAALDPFVQKVKFQNLDKKTQQAIVKSGGSPTGDYYVAGVSLKTYLGGTETKVGSTYGFVGLGERYGTGVGLGTHEKNVRQRMLNAGLSTQQFDAARTELTKLTGASNFCRDIVANDALNLVGKTPKQAQGIVTSHIKLMMKTHGIEMPLNDPQYIEKLKGADGTIDPRSLSRFSVHLEKEMHLKIIEKSLSDRGKSEMDNKDPMLHALLLMGVDAGIDSTQTNVMGVTTKTDTNESHVYNQNGEIMKSVEGVLSGKRPFTFSRSGLRIDRGMKVELNNERNRVAVNSYIPSIQENLDLV